VICNETERIYRCFFLQWLHERAKILRYMRIAFPVTIFCTLCTHQQRRQCE